MKKLYNINKFKTILKTNIGLLKFYSSEKDLFNPNVMIKQIIKNNNINIVPKELITKQLCIELVKECTNFEPINNLIPNEYKDNDYYKQVATYKSLKYIPKDKITREMCYLAIGDHIYRTTSFEYIPKEYKDIILCERALEYTVLFFPYIPKQLLTPDICIKTVSRCANNIKQMPDNMKTMDVCITAIKHMIYDDDAEELLQHMPDTIKQNSFFWKTVIENGRCIMFNHLPKTFKNSNFYEQLNKLCCDEYNLQYIPSELKTKKLYLDCINNRCISEKDFEKSYLYKDLFVNKIIELDEEIITALLNNNPRLIYFMGKINLPNKIINDTINKKYMLKYIPKNLLNYNLCEKAIQLDPRDIKYVPLTILDEKLCLIAVSKEGDLLENISFNNKTYKVCKTAIDNYPNALEYVPIRHYEDICDSILNWTKFRIEYIPKKYRTYDICHNSVSRYGNNIKYVPHNIITYELVKLAIDGEYIIELKYIPQIFKDKIFYEYCINKNILYVDQIDQQYATKEIWISAVKKCQKNI